MKLTVHQYATVVLAACLVANHCPSQCNSWQPDFVSTHALLPEYHEDLVSDALLLLDCCASCTLNPELMEAVSGLTAMLDDGKIIGDMATTSDWNAMTSPDCVFGNYNDYTASGDNYIVLNNSQMSIQGWSADEQASATIMGALLAHEYFHCVTLVNSFNRITEVWDDPCDYWLNEIAGYAIEVSVLSCIVSCGCIDLQTLSEEGYNDIDARGDVLGDWKDVYQDLYGGGGC